MDSDENMRAVTNGSAASPEPGKPMRGFLLGQRVRPVLLLACLGWFIFACFRIALLIATREILVDTGATDIAKCLLTGFRYDAVPIGYAMFPLALVLSIAPRRFFERKWFRRTVTVYGVAVTTIALFGEVVGIPFFMNFYVRYNWAAMAYFGHFKELAVFIWREYPVWLLAIGTVIVPCLCYVIYNKLFWLGRRPREARIAPRIAYTAVVLALCVLAGRGGLDSHPIRHGSAYISENNVINQITLNNFFTFARAALRQLGDNRDEGDLYDFPSDRESAETLAGMIVQEADTPLPTEHNPLWRHTRTGRPRENYNVVLVIMESMTGKPVGVLGNKPSQTPNLDRLCGDGLMFDRMYAVGPRTARGITGILSGHPDLGGQSILQRELSQGAFFTLPQVMKRRGYQTRFIYGGDPNFDNMRGFFKGAGGIDEFTSEKELRSMLEPGNWGLPDEVIFREAHRQFERLDQAGQKFFGVVLTVSNHVPFDVPLNKSQMLPHDTDENKKINAYRYSDWALGQFFRLASKADYFSRTIFILVADHGRDFNRKPLMDIPGYRVPCLFYAPGIISPRKISTVASQTDIAPTLLAMLGGDFEHCFFGRNMLDVELGDGIAFLHESDRLAMVWGDLAIILPPRQTPGEEPVSGPRMYRTDGATMRATDMTAVFRDDMRHRMLSYYKVARTVYFQSAYCRPPEAAPAQSASPGK